MAQGYPDAFPRCGRRSALNNQNEHKPHALSRRRRAEKHAGLHTQHRQTRLHQAGTTPRPEARGLSPSGLHPWALITGSSRSSQCGRRPSLGPTRAGPPRSQTSHADKRRAVKVTRVAMYDFWPSPDQRAIETNSDAAV